MRAGLIALEAVIKGVGSETMGGEGTVQGEAGQEASATFIAVKEKIWEGET
jgi:hypothetical protein